MGLIDTAVMISMPATSEHFSVEVFMSTAPIFRFTFMLNLLVWLTGWCIWWFERYKVNYVFLLNIDPKCPLDSSLVFRLASSMSGAWLLIFWAFLADFKFAVFSHTKAMVSVTFYPVLVLVTMFYIFSSTYITGVPIRHKVELLKCIFSVFCAPWISVTFAANLVGDTFTSFTRSLTDLIYSLCYLWQVIKEPMHLWIPHHKHRSLSSSAQYCHSIDSLWICSVILSLPYIFRLLQCLRRYRDDRTATQHLANAGKYGFSIVVTAVAFALPNSLPWIVCYTVATIYACAWDFRMDWGLRWESHDLKREMQMYPAWIYKIFAWVNLVGRSTWALSSLTPKSTKESISAQVFIFALSALEIYRRAQWAIVRIEHEHLTNSSKYRTLCWVPPLAPVVPKEKKEAVSDGGFSWMPPLATVIPKEKTEVAAVLVAPPVMNPLLAKAESEKTFRKCSNVLCEPLLEDGQMFESTSLPTNDCEKIRSQSTNSAEMCVEPKSILTSYQGLVQKHSVRSAGRKKTGSFDNGFMTEVRWRRYVSEGAPNLNQDKW